MQLLEDLQLLETNMQLFETNMQLFEDLQRDRQPALISPFVQYPHKNLRNSLPHKMWALPILAASTETTPNDFCETLLREILPRLCQNLSQKPPGR
jgi:hypothetical protein